jgi:hypothetical protein
MGGGIMSHSVYWNGGYISTDTEGLSGKKILMQRRLIAAVKRSDCSVVTHDGDELPIIPPRGTGNQNAAKPEADRASAFLHIRCGPEEKANWQRAKGKAKLATWVRDTLNEAAKPEK